MSKNNKKTINERTHNPFETYKHLHKNTTSHAENPEDQQWKFQKNSIQK